MTKIISKEHETRLEKVVELADAELDVVVGGRSEKVEHGPPEKAVDNDGSPPFRYAGKSGNLFRVT